ncbi:MAG: phosphoserine phosphatase SerB, partial [Shewanella sp.]|nr:phosphoserine phosphatase SerB [Shewanella sp.]
MESLNQDALFLWLVSDHSPRFECQGQVFERYQESANPAGVSRLRVIYQDTLAQAAISAWIAELPSYDVIGI